MGFKVLVIGFSHSKLQETRLVLNSTPNQWGRPDLLATFSIDFWNWLLVEWPQRCFNIPSNRSVIISKPIQTYTVLIRLDMNCILIRTLSQDPHEFIEVGRWIRQHWIKSTSCSNIFPIWFFQTRNESLNFNNIPQPIVRFQQYFSQNKICISHFKKPSYSWFKHADSNLWWPWQPSRNRKSNRIFQW